MAFQSVWWHSPLEYGAGLNPPKTWPNAMEQYRRPRDLRYRDIPTEQYSSKLYYEQPRMGQPTYRGLFRDKPHTVNSYHPSGVDTKPAGFHGRLYYEHGPPQFKHQGPHKDCLFWLEKPELQPTFPRSRPGSSYDSFRGLNERSVPSHHPSKLHLGHQSRDVVPSSVAYHRMAQSMLVNNHSHNPNPITSERLSVYKAPGHVTNRLTLDGVGYL